MKFKSMLWIVVVVIFVVGLFIFTNFMPEEKAPLDYVILKNFTNRNNSQGYIKNLQILIAPESSANDVKKLAIYLKKMNSSYDLLIIDIFDSKAAFLRRGDLTYSEKEFSKHWLAAINHNKNTNYDKILLLDKKTCKFVELK